MRKSICILLLALLSCTAVFAQGRTMTVAGFVADEAGVPVVGATVMIAGTQQGAVTDADGRYSIKCSKGDVLVFSCIGYEEYRETVSSSVQVNAVMRTAVNSLDEVVFVAYGTQTKSDLTGSVGVVNVDEAIKVPVTSVDQALQGRVAGLEVMNGSGDPSESATMRIRGTRSINAGNDPLIIVDGVIDAVEKFTDINPADIKSISVLKDASSTALYGSRGANGVILVTTRSAKTNEKISIRFNADLGVSSLLRELDVMDGPQFAAYRNDVSYMSHYIADTMEEYVKPYPDPSQVGTGTDWQKLMTQNAVKQSYHIAVNSGDSKRKFFGSFGYNNSEGIIRGTGMQRFTARMNVDWTLFKFLKLYLNTNYTYTDAQTNKMALNGYTSNAAACISPLLNETDTWNKYGDDGVSGGAVFNNPYLKATRETNGNNKNFLVISPKLEARFLKHFTLSSAFTYTMNKLQTFYYSPSDMPVAALRKTGGTAKRGTTDKTVLLSETLLNWNRSFKKAHKVEAMIGFTAEKNRSDKNVLTGSGYLDDNVTYKNMGSLLDARTLEPVTVINDVSRLSGLMRLNYSYRKRYYATFTGRADGSSIFAAGHKWGFFPAGALKWNIAEEKFMKKIRRKWLTELSLRVSGGISGNDALSSYVSQAALSNSGTGWLFRDTREVAYFPTRLDNASLTWEKTKSYNVGLDINILNGRVTATLEGYQSFTSDMLMAIQNSATTGYLTRFDNCGGTRNTGVEFSITSNNISTKKFNWKTSLTIGHNVQVVTDTGAGNEYIATYMVGEQMFYGFVKGYPANSLWGYQYAGVWHNEAERKENSMTRTYASYYDRNGYAKYVDVNHDGKLDKNDWIYLGTTDPLISGGFNNEFTFLGCLTLGVYFTYSYGARMYNLTEMYLGSGSTMTNQYKYMVNRWHPENNPDSDIVGAYCQDRYGSNRFVHDASYIRLKGLSLSYNLHPNCKWMRDLTLTLSGDNIFLWTPYNGYDPDVTTSSVARVDNEAYPYPRTFSFSLMFRY